MDFEERPISSKIVFHGHLIDVEVQQVITPYGNQTQREIVHHAPAIAILALTADDKMILEKQWRAPIAKTTLEIPAGKLDQRDADNAVHAAKRELNEETRYEAANLKKISSFYTSVGCMDEYMTLYLATGLERVTNELPQDQDEQLVLSEVTLPQALEMIDRGEIEDAKTIMAIYYWRGMNRRG
ncbi:NUDIX hydrolase [Limosilactobacillus sp. RRLNB_1_1]|uniref:NUDIX hydrolase n=1 Tax=Limosilactobacillus albertensis TaxID=2759752 RepID=A0A7W3TRJ1_9LACO|nr:NUDIX hydrolase [Limosilactobacillus albertensis]MBB1069321.1 NUDIX hydrolase [Limosilactobacillus albertensis]MCD7118379.1 NUDIX hydrolase [Limosilactobacillus albertensis]MCD7128522.1 NUDIX hydrolase [Limosilactobacillus albertensis]